MGAITDSAYRSLNIELSMSGSRKREPVEIEPEQPMLVRDVIRGREAAGETLPELAADALMSIEELERHYLLEAA